MALIRLQKLRYGAELYADAVVVGSYEITHPVKGRLTLPAYDVTSFVLKDAARVAKDRKTSGLVRSLIDPDVLSVSGRKLEYQDGKATLAQYTLTKAEQLALRQKHQSGLPTERQLSWSRFVRGPMSPTLEQEVAYVKEDTDANGSSVTIVAPDSGNLLVLCHGYYWRTATPGEPEASANSLNFTRRGYAGTANFEVLQSILDRVANGSEGTTVVVTNGGTSQENSGGFFEYSGMTSSPFVAISAGADGGSGDVTSVGTGNVDTTGTADTLIIATFGTDGITSSWGYTNSFTEELESQSAGGGSDHSTRVATRIVSAESSTYNSTASWTTGAVGSGIAAAYAIDVASPPVLTLPTGYIATNNLTATIISGISVAEGESPVTLITFTCTSGKGVFTATGSGSTTVSGDGTNAMSLLNGSETDMNNALATVAFQGTAPTQEKVTLAVLATDGTLNDSGNIVVFNDVRSLSVTADSYADAVACIQTLFARLPVGETTDTITITATDEDDLPDEQVITLFVPSSDGTSGGEFGQQKMFHYLGLGF